MKIDLVISAVKAGYGFLFGKWRSMLPLFLLYLPLFLLLNIGIDRVHDMVASTEMGTLMTTFVTTTSLILPLLLIYVTMPLFAVVYRSEVLGETISTSYFSNLWTDRSFGMTAWTVMTLVTGLISFTVLSGLVIVLRMLGLVDLDTLLGTDFLMTVILILVSMRLLSTYLTVVGFSTETSYSYKSAMIKGYENFVPLFLIFVFTAIPLGIVGFVIYSMGGFPILDVLHLNKMDMTDLGNYEYTVVLLLKYFGVYLLLAPASGVAYAFKGLYGK